MRTYEGETLEFLEGQLKYVNEMLAQNMEKWERKEYEEVKKELVFKINAINEYWR